MTAWRHWVGLAARREPAAAVALVRMGVGTAITLHFLRLWATGTWRWIWLPPEAGGVVPLRASSLDLIGVSPGLVEAVLLAGIAASALLAVGLATPVAAVLSALAWNVLTGLGPNSGGSYDFLGSNILFLLVFAGSGRALAVDSWLRSRRGLAPLTVPAWPRWLLLWQLVVMYDTTAWQKVSAGWVPGGPADALWFILQQPTWHHVDMRWLAPLYPLTQAATLLTWCFEHASPLLLLGAWCRHTRTRKGWLRAQFNRIDVRVPFLLVGVLLHVQIEALMEVGCFSSFTLALYLAAFSGDEVRRALPAWLRSPGTA